MGGPKYLYIFYYLRYFDPPNYGQNPLIFKNTIHGFETPFFTWFWVYYPPKINGGRMGGPKYLN